MSVPHNLPAKYRYHWTHPWTRTARRDSGFRRWLQAHGYLSPHFTLAEAASHDGKPVPRALRSRARNHAFRLEIVRHDLGDGPMPINSWYRSPAQNKRVHGARFSKHLSGIATDHPKAWVDRHPNARRVILRVFADGGVGQYPAGDIHLDSRGWQARWSDWVRT